MYPNSYKDYRSLAYKHGLVPQFKVIPSRGLTPRQIFKRLRDLNPAYIFESLHPSAEDHHMAYIGFKAQDQVTLHHMDDLDKKVFQTTFTHPDLPDFFGGYVGYRAYEDCLDDHNLPGQEEDGFYGFYSDLVVALNKDQETITIVFSQRASQTQYTVGLETIHLVEKLLAHARPDSPRPSFDKTYHMTASMSPAAYKASVIKAKAAIQEGHIFQTVLSVGFSGPLDLAPLDLYESLCDYNPAPHMVYMDCDHLTVLASSPETMVKTSGSQVSLFPIAGTRAIKKDGKDQMRAKDLIHDPKEKAEHLMLVDLGRNDLNQICQPASVRVKDFASLKTYSRVMHLTSHLEGLMEVPSARLALKATCPAGTVSGAPKRQAMKILQDLEGQKRGLYGGCLFRLNLRGDLSSCLVIRTLVVQDQTLHFRSGSGLVIESSPEGEHKEILNKAEGLFQSIRPFYKGGLSHDFSHR